MHAAFRRFAARSLISRVTVSWPLNGPNKYQNIVETAGFLTRMNKYE